MADAQAPSNLSLAQQLAQLLQNAQGGVAPGPAACGFTTPQSMVAAGQVGAPQPQAILFRINVPLPDGSEVSTYLQFPAAGLPPQAWQAIAQQLVQAGLVQPQQPRRQWGNGGGWGGGNGNGGGWRGGNGFGGRGRGWGRY